MEDISEKNRAVFWMMNAKTREFADKINDLTNS